MDTDTLERLILDRSLGALPPDCEALLAAWLERHPEAAAADADIEQVVRAARQAMADEPGAARPVFPAERLRRARQKTTAWSMARASLGLAAAAVLGFVLHGLISPAFGPDMQHPGSGARSAMVAKIPHPTQDEPAAGAGFWSTRRLYERAAEARQASSSRVIWDSPISRPRIGDGS